VSATATLPPFVFVTGSRGKAAEAAVALGRHVGSLETVALDLPEIQSLDLLAVLRAKGEAAWERLGRPLVVEDAALELAALHGFPGPLVKWMLAATGAEGLARVATALGDTAAVARCALLYRDARGIVVGEGATAGRLVLPGRGGHGFGWDPVFAPAGGPRTYAEMEPIEKDRVSHRGKAWRDLTAKLGGPPML
jgi:XTP/dITP diphosphohydrolase